MRFDGVLTRWDAVRGFGFIEPAARAGERIFVHINAFPPGTAPLEQQRLTFEVEPGTKGRKRATRVRPAPPFRPSASIAGAALRHRSGGRQRRPERQAPPDASSYLALPAFLLVYLAVALLWRVPGWVAALYAGASVLCFAAYAMDKAAARSGGWRTPENQLLLLGLVGGWPGAVLAQQLLRHKSRKQPFRTLFWMTVAINVALFVVLLGPWARGWIGG